MGWGLLFPGQGAQAVGMGQELAQSFPQVKAVWEEAEEVSSLPLRRLVWEGSAEGLAETSITQPAILTTSLAAYTLLQSLGIEFTAIAGFSLGELTALVASGAIRFEDGLRLVAQRGRLMEAALPPGVGGMIAVIGLDTEVVEAICLEVGEASPANYNCPGQIVISGTLEGLDRATQLCKSKGARRVIPLPVSGPFHSRWMEPAAKGFAEAVEAVEITLPQVPVWANATARPYADINEIREGMVRQIISPVRWQETCENLLAAGVDTFVELAPGQTLSGFLRKIEKSAVAYSLQTPQDYQNLLEEARRSGVS